jgi:predicted nucleotide-binding protein
MPLRPGQRYALVQALANFLVPLSESEVDAIFRTAGSNSTTPASWNELPEDQRVAYIRTILSSQIDDVLTGLMDFLPENEQIEIPLEPVLDTPSTAKVERAFNGPIFVVHGRARDQLYETVRVLERGTSLEVVILHEQANAGRTILEKFEDYAANASFAVVLLTGDDEGGIRSSADMRPRGRQNVIFELGFFFGKLGRDRVVVLHEGDVEKPSDISGLAYISLDQAGAWKQALARELEAANISVDRSRIP